MSFLTVPIGCLAANLTATAFDVDGYTGNTGAGVTVALWYADAASLQSLEGPGPTATALSCTMTAPSQQYTTTSCASSGSSVSLTAGQFIGVGFTLINGSGPYTGSDFAVSFTCTQ